MAESLLALPFLMIILLFIWYFGRNSVRVQRTHVIDRYEAWREVGYAHLHHRPQRQSARKDHRR